MKLEVRLIAALSWTEGNSTIPEATFDDELAFLQDVNWRIKLLEASIKLL